MSLKRSGVGGSTERSVPTTPKSKVNQAEVMRSRGYITAREASEKMGMDIASIYRWLETGEVDGVKVGVKRYVSKASLVKKLGIKVAVIFGIITEAEGKVIQEAKKEKKS